MKTKYNNYSKNTHCKCGKLITDFAKNCRKCADIRHSLRMTGKGNTMFGTHRTNKENPFYGKHHTKETKKKIRTARLGKKLSKEICKKISKNSARHWLGKKLPKLICQKISKTRIKKKLARGKDNGMFGKKAKHGKRIYYKGICMRSTWEILFAQFLSLSGYKWQYEPKVFDLGTATYRPDFYILEWDLYVEVKGWWRGNAKKKFNLFKKLYPNIRIKVLKKKELEEIGVI